MTAALPQCTNLAFALIQRGIAGWGQGGRHSGFPLSSIESHCSRLLITRLVQGAPAQGQDESGPPTQTRQVLEISQFAHVPR